MAMEVGDDPAGDDPVAIVPKEDKTPVVPSMLNIETPFEPEVTYANLPDGWTATDEGLVPAAIVAIDVRFPVVVSMLYIDTSFER
jgi:hypothetical protein